MDHRRGSGPRHEEELVAEVARLRRELRRRDSGQGIAFGQRTQATL